MKGLKKILGGVVFTALALGVLAGCDLGGGSSSPQTSDDGAAVCAHGDALRREAVQADCDTQGNIEYWECTACEKRFSDEACTKEISGESYKTAALGHTYRYGACEACGEVAVALDVADTTWRITSVEPAKHIDGDIKPWFSNFVSTWGTSVLGTEYTLVEEDVDGLVYGTAQASDKVEARGTVSVQIGGGMAETQGVWGQRGNYVWIVLGGEGYESYPAMTMGCYLEEERFVYEHYFSVQELEAPSNGEPNFEQYATNFYAAVYLSKRA